MRQNLHALKHICSHLRPPSRLPIGVCRSYGPQVSTLPLTIQPWVEAYEASIELELTGDNPYLFSMASSWERGLSSSAWTQLVKGVFERWSGVACPPKQLRASFCTYLRSADGVSEELLQSCAHAMKHQVATGGSSNYDKEVHHSRPHAHPHSRSHAHPHSRSTFSMTIPHVEYDAGSRPPPRKGK